MKKILIKPNKSNTERDYGLLKEYLKNYGWDTEEVEETENSET